MHRIDSAALRCPRAPPPRTAFYSPLASRCLHPRCTTSAASVTRRVSAAPPAPAPFAHRSLPRRSPRLLPHYCTLAPPAPAPLAHRSLPRRSRRLLTAAPPASALITDCAARSAPARSPPADAPHARAARHLAACAPPHFCLSGRVAPSVPTLHRVARAPLATPSAPLARRITHRTARRLPPRRCHRAARHRALRMSTA